MVSGDAINISDQMFSMSTAISIWSERYFIHETYSVTARVMGINSSDLFFLTLFDVSTQIVHHSEWCFTL